MAKSARVRFPRAEAGYEYPGAALKMAWAPLHRGDCEPSPGSERCASSRARSTLGISAGRSRRARRSVMKATTRPS
jgi:hypothetical protein